MKKLLAFVLIGGLFALGCSGAPTTKSKTSHKVSSELAPLPSHAARTPTTSGKPAGDGEKSGKSDKTGKGEEAKVSLAAEGATIAKGKDEVVITIKVDTEGEPGPVTLKFSAPEDVKLDKDSEILKAGQKEVKLGVKAVKRDKGEVPIKVTATSDKAKEATQTVTVKIEK